MPMDEMDDLSIPEQRHRRRARLIIAEILPSPRRGIDVLTGEHGHDLLRTNRDGERLGKRRTGIACRAPAHRIDEDQRGPLLVTEGFVHLGRRLQLLRTHPHHFVPHGSDESGIVGHVLKLLGSQLAVGVNAFGYSVDTCSAPLYRAALSACHDSVAHLTRTGNAAIPEKTASLPSPSPRVSSAV